MSKKAFSLSNKAGQMSEKLGQKSDAVRKQILLFFYENPTGEVKVRDLESILKISRSTIQYHLQDFRKRGFLDSKNHWVDSWTNRLEKVHFYINRIAESGLVEFLEKELGSSAIILFGSFSKGESVKSSDIDIFVECAREKTINLKKYERALGHRVELFTRIKITLLPKRLLNNVVNGVKLKGYFTIK